MANICPLLTSVYFNYVKLHNLDKWQLAVNICETNLVSVRENVHL